MITRENIVDLAKEKDDVCISIYLSTHKMGEEVQQDPIQLKNLLKDVRQQLKNLEISTENINSLLGKAEGLLDNPRFWQHNDQGLAIFIREGEFEYYRIPHGFKERALVDGHFLITPLIPMITLEGTFCVLALSQKNMRLLKCTRGSVETLALDDSPTSLEEFQRFDVTEEHLQHHSAQGGQGRAIFHGQGGGADTDTSEIINYLKTVENEVTSILRKRNDPLILAGVPEATAEYRKVNHYDRLMEETVAENPDPRSDDELREKAWVIIQSYFLQDMYDDMDRFADLSGSDKQSQNLTQIVEAAYYGKIDSLFVPIGKHSWGRFDQERDVVHHSKAKNNGEHDLINLAAIKTLTQSGNVYALQDDEMPEGSTIAAIFRYA